MYLSDDNDYDSDNNDLNINDNDYNEEIQYFKNIDIIMFYKNILYKEPEFIGINNICCGKILNIINAINSKNENDYKCINLLSQEQLNIFYNMYNDLNISFNNKQINYVCYNIFKSIYV
jgi:hypothetical protein